MVIKISIKKALKLSLYKDFMKSWKWDIYSLKFQKLSDKYLAKNYGKVLKESPIVEVTIENIKPYIFIEK